MAALDSGLSRIFATLLLEFLDRDLLIGMGNNRVSAEHGGRLPTSDGHGHRLGHTSAAQSTSSASPVRSRRSDGQYRWQLDRGVLLRDEDGNIVKWYGVTTDIEDRKRAEEELQESQFYLAEGQRFAGWSPSHRY